MRELKRIKIKDVLFIDIETSTNVKELQPDTPLFDSWEYKKRRNGETDDDLVASFADEAALYPEFGRIVCISVGMFRNGKLNTTTFNNLDEFEMIKDFFNCLDNLDSGTMLCGHAIKQFDIPYIAQRAMINGIYPHNLVDTSGLKPWELDWILDTKELWQGTSYNRSSLLNLTTALGLPSPKEDITGKDVPAYYWKDPVGHIQRISEYCERDVVAVYDLINTLKNLKGHNYERPVTRTFLEELFDGGSYGDEEKKVLLSKLNDMKIPERKASYVVLEAITSTARGKKTKFTKAHVRALKKEMND